MKMNFTPEDVAEFGRDLGDIWLARLAPSERLAGLKPSELLACMKPEEIEDYLKQLKQQAHFSFFLGLILRVYNHFI